MKEINKQLTTFNYTSGNKDRIKYIVIHYVGATGGAKANCNYYAGQYIGASAHYYVDFDGSIWQSVEDQNIAWHCGTKGKYYHPECRNSNSIGIELCVRNKGSKTDTSKDWYFEDETFSSAIQLTKELMKKYNVDIDHVIRHYDVTHKICPNPFVYNNTKHTWGMFKSALNQPSNTTGKEILTYDIKTDANGLLVSVEPDDVLNIRDYPVTGAKKGELRNGEAVFPDKKTFVDGIAWYRLPSKNGWICAKYLDGGWVYETSISSPYKWWFIHKNYTCTKQDIEVINHKIYKFDVEGYMIENATGKYMIGNNGEIKFD